jgi:hypothetical protein
LQSHGASAHDHSAPLLSATHALGLMTDPDHTPNRPIFE